ncbi:hypothetical protein [Mycolicibacterium sp.]|uniref:hypothetical protein n=1 Tax=Mycolicibacterium sp. TaxID=2320850 RepID=UPI00355FEDB4
MSVTLTTATTINGALVETGTVRLLDDRHELASGGYENLGGVCVVTEITACSDYPDLIGTRREWSNS